MSVASDRLALRDALVDYPLMTVRELSSFLRCSVDHARGLLEDGVIPFVDIGRGARREYRIDPVEAAVFVLRQAEGLSRDEYWSTHGPNGTVERCRQLLNQIRRVAAA